MVAPIEVPFRPAVFIFEPSGTQSRHCPDPRPIADGVTESDRWMLPLVSPRFSEGL
jgi:hypothetical protein